MSASQTARRILASGDVLTGTNAELREILEAYLESEAAIRELQQAACDRDGVPMPSQRPVVERLREALATLRAMSAAMAEDDGLWFQAETCAEAYLQQALRRLCAAIEDGHKHPLQGQEE